MHNMEIHNQSKYHQLIALKGRRELGYIAKMKVVWMFTSVRILQHEWKGYVESTNIFLTTSCPSQ